MTLRAWAAFLVALGGIIWMVNDPGMPHWALGIFTAFALRCMYEIGRQSKKEDSR